MGLKHEVESHVKTGEWQTGDAGCMEERAQDQRHPKDGNIFVFDYDSARFLDCEEFLERGYFDFIHEDISVAAFEMARE